MFQLTFFSGQIDMYFLTFVSITSNFFVSLLYTINITYYGIIVKFVIRQISHFKGFLDFIWMCRDFIYFW